MPDVEAASSPRSLRKFGIGAAIVALAVVGLGIGTRVRADQRLEAVAGESALPRLLTFVARQRQQRSLAGPLMGDQHHHRVGRQVFASAGCVGDAELAVAVRPGHRRPWIDNARSGSVF